MARLYISTVVLRNSVMPNPEDFLELEARGNWIRLLSGIDNARPLLSENIGRVRYYENIKEALDETEEAHTVWVQAAHKYQDVKDTLLLTRNADLFTRQNGAWKRDYALEKARDILKLEAHY
jgi:hypothetical protein